MSSCFFKIITYSVLYMCLYLMGMSDLDARNLFHSPRLSIHKVKTSTAHPTSLKSSPILINSAQEAKILDSEIEEEIAEEEEYLSDFDTDSLLMGDYNTIYSYTEDTSRSEKLPDLYADYMEKTPFWKEKIAPDRDKPLFDVYP